MLINLKKVALIIQFRLFLYIVDFEVLLTNI